MLTLTRDQIDAAIGDDVISSDGETVGTVTDIYYDVNSPDTHGWISLRGGLLKLKRRFVPLDQAELRDDCIYVPFSKDQILNSPEFEDDTESLGDDDTRGLWSSYGLEWADYERDYGGGEYRGDDLRGEETITRHEEELNVGTRETSAGSVRLRKWVETEPVSADVTLTRETAEVRREQIDQPVSGDAFGEEEIEVELRREEPVVEKQTVAKERVSIDTDTETETQRVTDTVRTEHVDVDRDGDVR